MIDGVHFADDLCVVALGIDIDGTKHPLALVEGIDGEHHPGPRVAGRPARARPGRPPADPGRAAQELLEALARELDKAHPGAAGSLREGLAKTLTVLRLDPPPTLARTLRSTNVIESMIGICRVHAKNVKRWRDGQMALRAGAPPGCSRRAASSGA